MSQSTRASNAHHPLVATGSVPGSLSGSVSNPPSMQRCGGSRADPLTPGVVQLRALESRVIEGSHVADAQLKAETSTHTGLPQMGDRSIPDPRPADWRSRSTCLRPLRRHRARSTEGPRAREGAPHPHLNSASQLSRQIQRVIAGTKLVSLSALERDVNRVKLLVARDQRAVGAAPDHVACELAIQRISVSPIMPRLEARENSLTAASCSEFGTPSAGRRSLSCGRRSTGDLIPSAALERLRAMSAEVLPRYGLLCSMDPRVTRVFSAGCYLPVRSRCAHPGQQQGRRWPSSSSSWVRRMRRSRVISCLASSTQQMNSLRARGVMSFQASSAVGLAISAWRRSPGSLCTAPPGTRGLLMGPRQRNAGGRLAAPRARSDR